jgi:hypothetical protein
MTSQPPLLLTLEDRLARIEALLVGMGTRLDRLERLAMRIDHYIQKPEQKRREVSSFQEVRAALRAS